MSTSYVISVSLATGCYRHIQIDANATLFELHEAIWSAFGLEEAHLHWFNLENKNSFDEGCYVAEPHHSCTKLTEDYTLQELGLEKEKKFKYTSEFQGEHPFQCRVLREAEAETAETKVIRSVGQVPESYLERESIFPERYPKSRLASMAEALPLNAKVVSDLRQYVEAAQRLYGIVPMQKVLELYNSQNSPIRPADFLQVMELIRHEAHFYGIFRSEDLFADAPKNAPMELLLVAEHLYADNWDAFYELIQAQARKPYYAPQKKEFLRYAQERYFDYSPSLLQMVQYLKDHGSDLTADAREIAEGIVVQIEIGLSMDSVIEELNRMNFQFHSMEDAQVFTALYQELSNNTRMLVNRGYTPMELSKLMQPSKPAVPLVMEMETVNAYQLGNAVFGSIQQESKEEKPKKVGRNAPCPCGSGKKYKKCCGR